MHIGIFSIILSIVILGLALTEFWFKAHADYIDNFIYITFVHLVLCTAIIIIFFFLFRQITFQISVSLVLSIVIVLFLNVLAYFLGRKYLSLNGKDLRIPKGSMQFIYLDYRFLLALTGDILFQQLVIATILLGLVSLGFTKPEVIIAICFLAIVWHTFYFTYRHYQKRVRLFNAILLTISVGLGILIMGFIFFKVTNGIIYNFLLHLSFYTIYGIALRWRFSKFIQ